MQIPAVCESVEQRGASWIGPLRWHMRLNASLAIGLIPPHNDILSPGNLAPRVPRASGKVPEASL